MEYKLSTAENEKGETILHFSNSEGRTNVVVLDKTEYQLLESKFDNSFIAPSKDQISKWFYQRGEPCDHCMQTVSNADILQTISDALFHFANLD